MYKHFCYVCMYVLVRTDNSGAVSRRRRAPLPTPIAPPNWYQNARALPLGGRGIGPSVMRASPKASISLAEPHSAELRRASAFHDWWSGSRFCRASGRGREGTLFADSFRFALRLFFSFFSFFVLVCLSFAHWAVSGGTSGNGRMGFLRSAQE